MDKIIDNRLTRPIPQVSLPALLVSFLRLGTSSFGGGMAGWTHREIVERRQWLDEETFMNTLTIAQILPGANPVNLAVYIGLKLRGVVGACIAFSGMLAPAFTVILLMNLVYERLRAYPETHTVLQGLACVGIASTLTMGIKTARRLRRVPLPMLTALAVFLAVGPLRWPLIPVVAVAIPASVLFAFYGKSGRKERSNG
jgi:chromate transporter